jgi:hypothetical protein
MLLAREFVGYLSRQIVRKLTPQVLETPNPQWVADEKNLVTDGT